MSGCTEIPVCRLAWRGRRGRCYGEWMRCSTRRRQAAVVAARLVARRGPGSCWVEDAMLPEAVVTAVETKCLAFARAFLSGGQA